MGARPEQHDRPEPNIWTEVISINRHKGGISKAFCLVQSLTRVWLEFELLMSGFCRTINNQ